MSYHEVYTKTRVRLVHFTQGSKSTKLLVVFLIQPVKWDYKVHKCFILLPWFCEIVWLKCNQVLRGVTDPITLLLIRCTILLLTFGVLILLSISKSLFSAVNISQSFSDNIHLYEKIYRLCPIHKGLHKVFPAERRVPRVHDYWTFYHPLVVEYCNNLTALNASN